MRFKWLYTLIDINAKLFTSFHCFWPPISLLFSSFPCLPFLSVTFTSLWHLILRTFFSLLSSFFSCSFQQFFYFLSSHIFRSFKFLFSTSNSFYTYFWVLTHNIHPQLMDLPWVEVHNAWSWVKEKTKSLSVLATLNIGFCPKSRCTCPNEGIRLTHYNLGRWVGE